MGCRQATGKERVHQQTKAKRIRNQCGLAEILCRDSKRVQGIEVQEAMPTTQQLKDAFNLRMKDTKRRAQEDAQISFWEVFDEFVKGVWQSE